MQKTTFAALLYANARKIHNCQGKHTSSFLPVYCYVSGLAKRVFRTATDGIVVIFAAKRRRNNHRAKLVAQPLKSDHKRGVHI
jgi:hypothetical protein